jgi:hypothetical protein
MPDFLKLGQAVLGREHSSVGHTLGMPEPNILWRGGLSAPPFSEETCMLSLVRLNFHYWVWEGSSASSC